MILPRLLPLLLLVSTASTAAAPGGAVAPGENLVIKGIPEIPVALADEIRPYTEFRGAGISDWHPARREMLIYTQFADTPQVHHLKFPGGARTPARPRCRARHGNRRELRGAHDARGRHLVPRPHPLRP